MKCDNPRVSVEAAAARMDKTPMFLRMWLRSGTCPFGTAIQMPGGRFSYYINAARFERYMAGEDMTTPSEATHHASQTAHHA